MLLQSLTHAVGKLIEFKTSCAPVFVQRAAEVAPALVVAHLQACRDTLVPLLKAPGVTLAESKGGKYAFFHLDGHNDCLDTAKRLVREASLGLAPGSAFGPKVAGWAGYAGTSPAAIPCVWRRGVQRLRALLQIINTLLLEYFIRLSSMGRI